MDVGWGTFLAVASLMLIMALPNGCWGQEITIKVNIGYALGVPTYRASGFIYGLAEDGTSPPSNLLEEIKVRFLRAGGAQLDYPYGGWINGNYLRRWKSVCAYYKKARELGATFILLVHDLWGADGVCEVPRYPGDGGDWSEYEVFLNQVIDDAIKYGMVGPDVHWDIWNEPDIELFWPRSQEQYLELWRRAYHIVRARLREAVIVGPSTARQPRIGDLWFEAFLDFVKENAVVPDFISWHELVTNSDPCVSADELHRMLKSRELEVKGFQVNEYGPRGEQGPGISAWYIARLERSQIDGARANWGMYEALYDSMGALVVKTAQGYQPLPSWWVYRRYAEMTGNLVSLESNSALVDGVAVMSEKQARAWILLGSRGFVGRVIIEMINLPTTSESVRVVVERVPGSWVVDKPLLIPEVVVDSVTRIEQGVLRLALDWRSSLDAYCITLDFAETGGQARL